MKKLLLFLPFLLLTLWRCTNDNPPEPVNPPASEWYCLTIADQQTDPTDSLEPHERAVAYKDKFWPVGYKFKVGFMGNRSSTQTDLVKSVCAEWSKWANVTFEFPAAGPYDIRISFNAGGGAWSYVGTDCKMIAQANATMNLGWIARDAYLHEFGHTLGLLHEHQNPTGAINWNKPVVYAELGGPPNNWSKEMIDFNVLNPYPLPNVITTALDKVSIMHYPIPARWTLDGYSSPGGQVISEVDKAFISARYPFTQPPTTGSVTLSKDQVDALIRDADATKRALDSLMTAWTRQNTNLRKAIGRQ